MLSAVGLPDEIWVDILDYLEPNEVVALQRISKKLLKLTRDSSVWKNKCFEKAPDASVRSKQKSSRLFWDTLGQTALQDADGIVFVRPVQAPTRKYESNRARAIAEWDCTGSDEKVDWYAEYIARHAPLVSEWWQGKDHEEIQAVALFDDDRRVLAKTESGKLQVFSVEQAENSRRHLSVVSSGANSVSLHPSPRVNGPPVTTAVDSTVVDSSTMKAYIAVNESLSEVDLATMQVISTHQYPWPITAISPKTHMNGQQLPLMIGTSYSLEVHDPRFRTSVQPRQDLTAPAEAQNKVAMFKRLHPSSTIMQDQYDRLFGAGTAFRSPQPDSFSDRFQTLREHPSTLTGTRAPTLESWLSAHIEPGPQSILHRSTNEVVIAGRMPSILFYDVRNMPKTSHIIHSGARLSSLATIPYSPYNSTDPSINAETLIAGGEYNGRGSLEIYGLSPPDSTHDVGSEPYSYKNRQSSSSAKLLSVATQGARIVFSDSNGALTWFERDGRSLARKWNVNDYYMTNGGASLSGDRVARKILTFGDNSSNDELLVWTGSEVGIIGSKPVRGKDEKKGGEEVGDEDEDDEAEKYAKTMRKALERQADERRWMSQFGGRWRYTERLR